ncbi:hypothetical protein Cgig2_004121 [Carnegiea gigantea]|uniref:Amine oxidase n=1 Tax=Carnegiea gigantea TaxID=171969 RepID=A0A9Q1KQN5_9CARY|nr:hypothetical protein Cgig2_004121 [Carnegiea gigantea]
MLVYALHFAGIRIMPKAQISRPLDPLIAAEISLAVEAVRATGVTSEVRPAMVAYAVSLVKLLAAESFTSLASQNSKLWEDRVDCPMENGYVRPVEGIHVLVDLQRKVVTEFEDRKFVPLPPLDPLRNYTAGETRGGGFDCLLFIKYFDALFTTFTGEVEKMSIVCMKKITESYGNTKTGELG